MEKRNDFNEEMPQAQNMQAADKKHNILLYVGIALCFLGQVFSMLEMDGLFILCSIPGIIVCCIGLYKTFKYKKAGTGIYKKK